MGSNPGMALHHRVSLDWSILQKEFFKQASTTVGDILWMLNFMNVWMNKNIFKKEPSKIELRGSRTHNLVITRPLLYHLHHHFLLQLNIFLLHLNHAYSDLLIHLFVANVHMISNRKTFVLNHDQLGFKFEKFYLSKSG
jgi:hypothetical protein